MARETSARRIATQIFAEESPTGATVEEAVSALARIHGKLMAAMSPVIGEAGFLAVFARTVRKAGSQYPCLAEVASGEPGAIPARLWSCLDDKEPALIREIGVSLALGFFELLSSFIGEDLTSRIVLSKWPGVAASASASVENP